MARILVLALLVLIAAVVVVGAHVAEGKQPALKTIASIVVHAHHHASVR
jgi:hypothetical protein